MAAVSLARASLELVPASFSYELVCHVAACVWVSMFAIWNLVFVQLFVYLFIRALLPVARSRSSGPLGVLLSSPALDVRLMTALQVLQVLLGGKASVLARERAGDEGAFVLLACE